MSEEIKQRSYEDIRKDMKEVELKIDQLVERGIDSSDKERKHYNLLRDWFKVFKELREL